MVTNANFSLGTNGWAVSLANSGSATWAVANQLATFTIANGGTYTTDIQLQQTGFRMIQGFQYILWRNRVTREIQVGAYNVTYPVAGLPVSLFITNGIGVLSRSHFYQATKSGEIFGAHKFPSIFDIPDVEGARRINGPQEVMSVPTDPFPRSEPDRGLSKTIASDSISKAYSRDFNLGFGRPG